MSEHSRTHPPFQALVDGVRVDTPAVRFHHWVDNVRFWFALHPSIGCAGQLTVSHCPSGMAVCRYAGGELDLALARTEIDKVVERVGGIQVVRALLFAERTAQAADSSAVNPVTEA